MKYSHFIIASVLALVGVVLLFQIDSAIADKHNLNSLFKIGGILLIVSAVVWIIYKYNKQGGNPNRG